MSTHPTGGLRTAQVSPDRPIAAAAPLAALLASEEVIRLAFVPTPTAGTTVTVSESVTSQMPVQQNRSQPTPEAAQQPDTPQPPVITPAGVLTPQTGSWQLPQAEGLAPAPAYAPVADDDRDEYDRWAELEQDSYAEVSR